MSAYRCTENAVLIALADLYPPQHPGHPQIALYAELRRDPYLLIVSAAAVQTVSS
jgi:hypothetical protein